MSTRIQDKSRTAKKVMGHGSATGVTIGKKPRADKKGYPATAGVPIPVLIGKAAASAPASAPASHDEAPQEADSDTAQVKASGRKRKAK